MNVIKFFHYILLVVYNNINKEIPHTFPRCRLCGGVFNLLQEICERITIITAPENLLLCRYIVL